MTGHPTYLDPSELGTKEYWDKYYQNDLDQNDNDDDDEETNAEPPTDPADLESWFDDVNAPAKVLEYLTSSTFPLSPNIPSRAQPDHKPTVLDLGTGNGGMLFTLRTEGNYQGPMVGVDYSQQSVDLATKLRHHFRDQLSTGDAPGDITFRRVDLIREDPRGASWWPREGFDLVLDKGTFDAVSLSEETVEGEGGSPRRICELYPGKVVGMVAPRGFLLVTSCNWTEEEVVEWFLRGDGVDGRLRVFGRIEYPVYKFGGHVGQGVASICFQKI